MGRSSQKRPSPQQQQQQQQQQQRSPSGGSYRELVPQAENSAGAAAALSEGDVVVVAQPAPQETVRAFLQQILALRDASGKTVLHPPTTTTTTPDASWASSFSLSLLQAVLHRCVQLDASLPLSSSSSDAAAAVAWQRYVLLQRDIESGYTPLHGAIDQCRIPELLLLLRHAAALESATTTSTSSSWDADAVPFPQQRFKQRPLQILQSNNNNNNTPNHHQSLSLRQAVVSTLDHNGDTPEQLLLALQQPHLQACRQRLRLMPNHSCQIVAHCDSTLQRRRSRGNSFEYVAHEQQQQQHADDFSEFHGDLQQLLQQQQQQQEQENQQQTINSNKVSSSSPGMEYACEVLTFGRAHHCAMGVVDASLHNISTDTTSTTTSCVTNSTEAASAQRLRPHRVPAFCPKNHRRGGGGGGSTVAVAASTYHTLLVTREGHLYTMGLGKGGRLGTGHQGACPVPTRVGLLHQQRVRHVAAAENHSLCVTDKGHVFAWGSNRFGQLGVSTAGGGNSGASSGGGTTTTTHASSANYHQKDTTTMNHGMSCVPRRVEDLKQISCVSVAAGERHSVALTHKGQVYVWGDNTAGQLGIPRRNGVHKVQRVEALCGSLSFHHHCKTTTSNTPPHKVAIAIAASEQATLVLTLPTGTTGLPVNAIYAWGHGNHVPTKVIFDPSGSSKRNNNNNSFADGLDGRHFRTINPVAIACARYHNVAISSDGRVYTWGLHTESLGTTTPHKKSSSYATTTSPQLVTGLLPEHGGGFAVAVSASENHTAVVTANGMMFTWGATYGKNILGHEGVRWQPNPKRVAGVHRAVAVAAAKEHIVFLMGTAFPPIPTPPPPPPPPSESIQKDSEQTAATQPTDKLSQKQKQIQPLSLEILAAQKVAQHVDLFNIFPILIVAERTHCQFLIDYCHEFIRCNLDGVLNVAQKSVMDCYLNEQLRNASLADFDTSHHQNAEEHRDGKLHPLILDVLKAGNSSSFTDGPCAWNKWMDACHEIAQHHSATTLMEKLAMTMTSASLNDMTTRSRKNSRSVSFAEASGDEEPISVEERCAELTKNLHSLSKEQTEFRISQLAKEIRAIRKRLSQIARLEENNSQENLSTEQRNKIARGPQLQADLDIFEPTLEQIRGRLESIRFTEEQIAKARAEKEMQEASRTSKENPDRRQELDTTRYPQETCSASFVCSICQIVCPDQRSYDLHMNGRKHRNRVAQEKETEAQSAAASMLKEQQKQQLLAPKVVAKQAPRTSTSGGNPWKKRETTGPQPAFKLPPPPHPVPDTMAGMDVKTPPPKKSLLDIMNEEQRHTSHKSVPKNKSSQLNLSTGSTRSPSKLSPWGTANSSAQKDRSASTPLTLPAGSAPAMKSPPWASAPKAIVGTSASLPTVCAKPMSPSVKASGIVLPTTAKLKSPSFSPKAITGTTLVLPEEAVPTMKSPPWASAPKVTVLPPPTLKPLVTSPPVTATTPKSSYSLGDYMTPTKTKNQLAAPKTPPAKPRSGSGAWTASPKKPSNPTVSFRDIQQEETDFLSVQDHAYGSTTKWFIERRERAGSFNKIQEDEEKEKEMRLFVEEQKRIEEQIHRDLAKAKKEQEEKARKQASRKKNNNNHKRKSKNHAKNQGNANKKSSDSSTKPNNLKKPTNSSIINPRQRSASQTNHSIQATNIQSPSSITPSERSRSVSA